MNVQNCKNNNFQNIKFSKIKKKLNFSLKLTIWKVKLDLHPLSVTVNDSLYGQPDQR